MGALRVEIEIDAAPSTVWTVIEDISTHVDWMADAESITFRTDQRKGIGTRFICVTKVGPIATDDLMEITEWEPGEVMGVRHQGLVTGTGRFTLAPLDLGRRTKFVWSENLRFPWFLGGRIGEVLGGKLVMGVVWRKNLRSLKRRIENNSQPEST